MLNAYSHKPPLCLLVCFLITTSCVAAPRYLVGPLNGKWSNAANWSAANDDAGEAGGIRKWDQHSAGPGQYGKVTSKSMTDFGAFTFGYEDPKKDGSLPHLVRMINFFLPG